MFFVICKKNQKILQSFFASSLSDLFALPLFFGCGAFGPGVQAIHQSARKVTGILPLLPYKCGYKASAAVKESRETRPIFAGLPVKRQIKHDLAYSD
jgi:hypothetical protein